MVERRGTAALLGLGVGGVLGAAIASLRAARPAEGAPPDEKLEYLLECLNTLCEVLAELADSNRQLITQFQQWLAAQGIEPAAEVSILTQWSAKEPEQIFNQDIRATGTFYSEKMVDWTKGKRLLFKVESSLNQAVEIQLIGNISDDRNLATDVGPSLTCTANGNISVGPAWDDWHPYIGVRITVSVAPTAGILTISAVIQE